MGTLQIAVFGAFVAGVCIATGFVVRSAASGEWKTSNWAGVFLSVFLSWAFLGLAKLLGAEGARQGGAVADSSLRDGIGQITAGGLLSMADGAHRSVDVGRHALAGLPLFDFASADMQRRFIVAIEQAYSAMALNVFPNNYALPRVLCEQLHDDGRELARGLRETADRWRNARTESALRGVADLVEHCLELERWYRDQAHAPEPSVDDPQRQDSELKLSVDELRRMYSRELQVYSCWHDPGVERCKVEISTCPVAELKDCYSVWYVRGQSSTYTEVDYSGEERTELGESRHFKSSLKLDHHPSPLRHDVVRNLHDLRRDGISKMTALMKDLDTPTVTVLVYRLAGGAEVVLDGNHRLAAALRWQGDNVPRAIVFRLRELPDAELIVPEEHRPTKGGQNSWTGMNPDIENMRDSTAGPNPRAASRSTTSAASDQPRQSNSS